MKENIKLGLLSLTAVALIAQVVVTQIRLEAVSKTQTKVAENLTKVAETQNTETPKEIQDQINAKGYQGVFLVGGQVYFGKLKEINANFFSLTDIYYLKEPGSLDISLIKLGDELHGPKDFMYIPKSQVQFIENLKEDGEVVKAIRAYDG